MGKVDGDCCGLHFAGAGPERGELRPKPGAGSLPIQFPGCRDIAGNPWMDIAEQVQKEPGGRMLQGDLQGWLRRSLNSVKGEDGP